MNENPDIPEVLARLGQLSATTNNTEIKELAACIVGLCFTVLGIEQEVEAIEERHAEEDIGDDPD